MKLAVSGCPRNCAESTIKDLGVIAIDGGSEIYVGGNGGTKVRAAELLVKVKTDEEVLEWTGAYLQYYRETANYMERTSEWIQRVGLDSVKKALEKKEDREALVSSALRGPVTAIVFPSKRAIQPPPIVEHPIITSLRH